MTLCVDKMGLKKIHTLSSSLCDCTRNLLSDLHQSHHSISHHITSYHIIFIQPPFPFSLSSKTQPAIPLPPFPLGPQSINQNPLLQILKMREKRFEKANTMLDTKSPPSQHSTHDTFES